MPDIQDCGDKLLEILGDLKTAIHDVKDAIPKAMEKYVDSNFPFPTLILDYCSATSLIERIVLLNF
jgi:hypothetical protein